MFDTMVWIDTDALRRLSSTFDRMRDSLVPAVLPASASGCGFPELVSACTGFDDEARRSQVVIAREIDALATGAVLAAQHWERAEQSAAGAHVR